MALRAGVCGTKHWEMAHLSLGPGVCGMGRVNWAAHALLGKGAALGPRRTWGHTQGGALGLAGVRDKYVLRM